MGVPGGPLSIGSLRKPGGPPPIGSPKGTTSFSMPEVRFDVFILGMLAAVAMVVANIKTTRTRARAIILFKESPPAFLKHAKNLSLFRTK
jgi:hypothetical protein